MKKVGNKTLNISNDRWKALTKKSTVDLIRLIVEQSDNLAINVIMETRRLFRLKGNLPLTLPEFLWKLREGLLPPDQCGIDQCMLADCAYDLTLAKYTNFPDSKKMHSRSSDKSIETMNVDCRNYYRAFLRIMNRSSTKGAGTGQIQEESHAGNVLKRLVYRNFLRAKEDCYRKNPFSIRYTWETKERKFILLYPSYMTAKEFTTWLKQNAEKIDLKAPDAQSRLRSLIDTKLKRGGHIGMDALDDYGNVSNPKDNKPCSIEIEQGRKLVSVFSHAVAKEKANNIKKLRPGIAKLGKVVLKQMIEQIFQDISEDNYQLTQIAKKFGVSKPTLSRFAGSQWFSSKGRQEKTVIPDLWLNTAETLSENPDFIETALNTGAGSYKNFLKMIRRENNDDV